mmetsp:Transcript_1909/g.4876  ORF Transcript_1909/g.4876 Transcript_1909/m.4876 type:complete len:425 (-) Transcript_1909:397-1671(-)|eukprot:CAMPEP_0115371190 /NCGR_PEP_ID=MMETSP0271-20121206/243_1 /TAXON_ID=71861 /ORGANISM="Scrippsiella trochoidea, Strain CCMP3099" /LENGTH=424 /DNA_ID=CAMNT_0002794063 /DNA_START=56 /DNA_END=1330 /DNA_ORIENTATION=-
MPSRIATDFAARASKLASVTPDRCSTWKHRLIAFGFSFITGYADVISVTRWSVFATTMTANVIYMGQEVTPLENSGAQQIPARFSGFYHIIVICAFFLGVVAYQLAELRFPNRGASTLAVPAGSLMFLVEVSVKAKWLHIGHTLYPLTVVAYAPMFGVLASAGVAGRLATMTTGADPHIFVLANVVVKLLHKKRIRSAERVKAGMAIVIILSLLAGSISGFAIVQMESTQVLQDVALLPVGPVLAILFFLHDHLAKPQRGVENVKEKAKVARERAQSFGRRIKAASVRFSENEICTAENNDSDREFEEEDADSQFEDLGNDLDLHTEESEEGLDIEVGTSDGCRQTVCSELEDVMVTRSTMSPMVSEKSDSSTTDTVAEGTASAGARLASAAPAGAAAGGAAAAAAAAAAMGGGAGSGGDGGGF